ARPQPGGVREKGLGDLPRQGVLHEHDDARAVHLDGFHAAKDAAGVLTPRRTALPLAALGLVVAAAGGYFVTRSPRASASSGGALADTIALADCALRTCRAPSGGGGAPTDRYDGF